MVKKASTIWLPLDKQAEIKEDGADKKKERLLMKLKAEESRTQLSSTELCSAGDLHAIPSFSFS